jgi:hypothetical protein
MPYVIDRQRALRAAEIVAVLSIRRRRVRSRVVLRDNSWHDTLTRPGSFRRQSRRPPAVQRRRRSSGTNRQEGG